MCDACDNDDGERGPRLEPALIAAAREIEAGMPGNPVSDEAWAIFAGAAGGGIGWTDYQRMWSSYEAAELADAGLPVLGRRRNARAASLRCEWAS
jgi:hypothetical protein